MVSIEYAKTFWTPEDERNGNSKTKEFLQDVSDDDLKKEYLECNKRRSNAMFGQTTRRWQDLIAEELLRRGISGIPNIFGVIPIQRENSTD
jgi:hypothetical protein